ncbi:MAG TPA: nitroreductase family deazaflavin-dependent oxidoreductase [Chloroflexota bacterium]|nr:nitroreductase family deazaflavin-dependent oxidoreductase [Chloroflexota bacterium]
MSVLWLMIGIWAFADAAFVLLAPRRWSRWWRDWLRRIGGNELASRLVALIELASAVYLIRRSLRHAGAVKTGTDTARAHRAAVGIERSGLLTALMRVPVYLYRFGLGWLLGHRFLLLTHRGRKSGRSYRTVLEVVHYDPETRESIVVSGWGTAVDWYRNIKANPPIAVATGGRPYRPSYRELSPDETYPIIADYLAKSPLPMRAVARRLLFGEGTTEAEQREQARAFVMVAFRPAEDQIDRQTGNAS